MVSDSQPRRLLIGRERIFYTGLLGNSRKTRRLGSFTIHVATNGSFDIKVGDGTWQSRRIFALKPFTSHQLWSSADSITTVTFESETVDLAYMEELFTQINESEEGIGWRNTLKPFGRKSCLMPMRMGSLLGSLTIMFSAGCCPDEIPTSGWRIFSTGCSTTSMRTTCPRKPAPPTFVCRHPGFCICSRMKRKFPFAPCERGSARGVSWITPTPTAA